MAYKIAFYKSMKGKLSQRMFRWAISAWTGGIYSHCEFINTNGSDDTTKWRWISSTGREHGCVAIRHIEADLTKWDIFNLSNDIDFKQSMLWGISKLNYKYDWLGIFLSQIFPWEINNPKKYFCSEFVAEQLKQSDLLKSDTLSSQSYSPNSLYRKLKQLGAIKKWQ